MSKNKVCPSEIPFQFKKITINHEGVGDVDMYKLNATMYFKRGVKIDISSGVLEKDPRCSIGLKIPNDFGFTVTIDNNNSLYTYTIENSYGGYIVPAKNKITKVMVLEELLDLIQYCKSIKEI